MMYVRFNPEINYGIKDKIIVMLIPSDKKYIKMRLISEIEYILDKCNDPIELELLLQDCCAYENRKIFLAIVKYFLKNKILVEETSLLLDDRFYNQRLYFRKYKNDVLLGDKLFEKIRNGSVTIIGAGAIGANLAILLASVGIKKIIIIDGDVVEESNLTRQFFYKEKDVNRVYKVLSLKRSITELNSEVEFCEIVGFISEEDDYDMIIRDSDIIIQTADKPFGKIDRFVNKISLRVGIPSLFVHADLIGPFVKIGKTGCYECFENQVNEESNYLYDFLVENYSKLCKTSYASIAHGSLNITEFIFSRLIEFYDTGNISQLVNHTYSLSEASYRYFSTKKGCVCQNEGSEIL